MKISNVFFSAGMVLASALACSLLFGAVPAQAQEVIKLSEPDFNRGANVLTAMKNRKSDREFDSRASLSAKQISEILWAAGGINRATTDAGKPGRTTPSSHDDQAITIYAFTADGVYRYNPARHELEEVVSGDNRNVTGVQNYVAQAPLNLVYVANLSQTSGGNDTERKMNAAYDTGHISQNVYLYCASAGLNVIVRSSIDKQDLRRLLSLNAHYEPLLGQTIGHPPK